MTWIPRGEASQIYRELPEAVDDLCAHLAVEKWKNGEY